MTSLKFIASVVIFAILAAFLGIASAQSGPKIPHVAVQSKGEKVANAYAVAYEWYYYTSNGEEKVIYKLPDPTTDTLHWPNAKVEPGAKVWVKVMRPDKPDTLQIEYFKEIYRDNHFPKGKAHVLKTSKYYSIRGSDGKVKGWKTYFYTKDVSMDYYIEVDFSYDRDLHTHHSYGSVSDIVHLKTTC